MTKGNYDDILEVVQKHIEQEGDVFRNIRRKMLTKSGERLVVRNVYNIMLTMKRDVNDAICDYEQILTNENY